MRWLIVFTVAAITQAQLEHSYERYQPGPRNGYKSPVVRLPQQDNEALRANEVPFRKVFKFGTPVPVKTSIADGEWTDVRDGRVWSISFQSSGAHSMNLQFSRFRVPHGAALWIHVHGSGQKSTTQGAFTEENNYESGEFVSWPVEGDSITLEYFEPSNTYGKPVFDVRHVVHGYQRLGCNASGACNVNSACDDKFGGFHANQKRAGALVLQASGGEWCSGSLINTIGNSGRQLFLTADHCGNPSSNFGSLKFQFASDQCEPTNCPEGVTIGDLKELHRKVESDTALLEIGERIPESWNVFLSGFSASRTPTSQVVGIHHPSGDVQKMAYAYKSPTYDRWGGGAGPSSHWRVASWDNLTTTEGGSSGSPLYDANQRIIGQLTGGTASCFNPSGWDAYGGLYFSWAEGLNAFLNPSNSADDFADGINLNDARRMHPNVEKLPLDKHDVSRDMNPKLKAVPPTGKKYARNDRSEKMKGVNLEEVRARKYGSRQTPGAANSREKYGRPQGQSVSREKYGLPQTQPAAKSRAKYGLPQSQSVKSRKQFETRPQLMKSRIRNGF